MSAPHFITYRLARAFAPDYPGAPEGIEHFDWQRRRLEGMDRCEPAEVPVTEDIRKILSASSPSDLLEVCPVRMVNVYPRVGDAHAGIPFYIGWDAEHRIAVLWS